MTFANVPLNRIQVHPSNPRRSAVADEEMVDSVRSLGILTPVTLAPADEDYILIGGHRRLDAAIEAELTQVPAVIREDLVTEAQQVEAMLVENLHREDLTPVEEAAAYEQLTLFGMSAAAIAKATGRKVSTVKSRLKLAGLTDTARERLHTGDVTLGDAEALLEFADDPEATKELEDALGTPNFRYKLQWVRDQRKRDARRAELIAEFTALGATFDGDFVGRPLSHFTDEKLHEPKGHKKCLAYAVPGYGEPYLVCTNVKAHPAEEDPSGKRAQEESEWEKQRAAREARRDRLQAAAAARLAFLVDHFAAVYMLPKGKPGAGALRAEEAFMPLLLIGADREFLGTEQVLTAVGIETADDYRARDAALTDYADSLSTGAAAHRAFTSWLAALVEDQLGTEVEYIDDPRDAKRLLFLWDWLESAGHTFSEVDNEIRDSLAARVDATPDEEAAS